MKPVMPDRKGLLATQNKCLKMIQLVKADVIINFERRFSLSQKCGHPGFCYLLEARKNPHFPGFADKLPAPIWIKWFVNCLEMHQQLQTVNSKL